MRVGICFGCFIPLHKGHVKLIRTSIGNNDHTIIGICGYDGDRGKDFVPFRDRIELIKKAYGGRTDVTLAVVDDKKIGLTGKFDTESWDKWCEELFKNSGFNANDTNNEYVWYLGEPDYLSKISGLYPNHKVVRLYRSIIPISGTMIRQNPQEFRNYIHPVFADYLARKDKEKSK